MEAVLAALVAAPAAAFAVGAVARGRWSGAALAAILATPLLVYTFWLAAAPPSPPGFWSWWFVGLLYAAPMFLLSAAVTLAAFCFGRALRR